MHIVVLINMWQRGTREEVGIITDYVDAEYINTLAIRLCH